MTRLRKLAVKISDTVVRRSLPAYKDWAQATARELEFIKSDWAALWWALGSWKMAASCQNAPLTSLCEVPRAARRFLIEIRASTVISWMSLLWLSYWFSGIFRYPAIGRSRDLGWGLIAAVLVYIACQAIAFRGWRMPRGGDLKEVAGVYRSALAHQRDVESGVWYWSRAALFVAGPLVSAHYAWLLKPGAIREALFGANLVAGGVIALSMAVTRPLTRRVVARYQRTIEQLDALAADGR